MRKILFVSLYCIVAMCAFGQQVDVGCGGWPGIRETVSDATGLNAVYVVYQADGYAGVNIDYTPLYDDGSPIKWYKIDKTGTPSLLVGKESNNLRNVEGDCGYMRQQGAETYTFWIVNYLNYSLVGRQMTVEADETDACNYVRLRLTPPAVSLPYYTVSGIGMTLPSRFFVAYNTLEWNKDDLSFNPVAVEEQITNANQISVPAPTCDTEFSLTDKYLKEWGIEPPVQSEWYYSARPVCQAVVEQYTRDNRNEWDRSIPSDGSFGGSAPAEITFKAYYNDVVTHSDWQFSADENFNVIDAHYYNTDDFQYTFDREGTTYVRLVVSTGTCQDSTGVFRITIGESRLEAPNIFSPGSTPGVNDEWKVAYKSIVDFKCWIYNRWGVEMFHFEDPAKGWDGRYRGRLVEPGVYFYVIRAKGADGRSHNLKGHINILRARE
ncbi:MAG: gliding motility-associated C-terminal domain-containing protein [Coprobacter sp.]|nr:gliding motility-associated C-terminal domain-containing protein [Coprobacter sp.]